MEYTPEGERKKIKMHIFMYLCVCDMLSMQQPYFHLVQQAANVKPSHRRISLSLLPRCFCACSSICLWLLGIMATQMPPGAVCDSLNDNSGEPLWEGAVALISCLLVGAWWAVAGNQILDWRYSCIETAPSLSTWSWVVFSLSSSLQLFCLVNSFWANLLNSSKLQWLHIQCSQSF